MRLLTALCFTCLLVFGAGGIAGAAEKSIIIGTAGEQGVYYPAGGAICRLIKRGIKDHGIHCTVRPTSGTVYNLNALQNGKLDLAIVQSDWLYQAYHGLGGFSHTGADRDLRAVFQLHTEAFTLLAREGSGIRHTRDLAGKRIAIGDDGSGMRVTAEEFIKAEGWTEKSFASVIKLRPEEQEKALCGGTVDAVLITTGHPNGGTLKTTHGCKTRLVPVEGLEIDKLLAQAPYYSHVSLPGGLYVGSPNAVPTFGVKAVLVTTTRVNDDIIYEVVKAVFSNLDNFKTLHPVFASLSPARMANEGTIIPYHPGALRYYRENGLAK